MVRTSILIGRATLRRGDGAGPGLQIDFGHDLLNEGDQRLFAIGERDFQKGLRRTVRHAGHLAYLFAIEENAQTFQFVVIEAVILGIIQRFGEELGAAQGICGRAVRDFLEGDEQAPLMSAHRRDGELVFLLALFAVENLADGETGLGGIGGHLDGDLAFNAVGFHHATNE